MSCTARRRTGWARPTSRGSPGHRLPAELIVGDGCRRLPTRGRRTWPLLIQRAEIRDEPDLVIGSRWALPAAPPRAGTPSAWALSKAREPYINAMLGLRQGCHRASVFVLDPRRMTSGRSRPRLRVQVNMTKLVDEIGGRIVRC